MNRYITLLVFLLGAVFNVCIAEINVPKEYEGIAEAIPPKKINWVERSKFGSKGNVTVYVNEDGTPKEVYVIGVATVPTSMVAADAMEDAMEDAEFSAKGAFALWMHENFRVQTKREKKTLVVRKNGEENSEVITISKREAEQMASGMWRGMTVFWHKLEENTYYVVWRWSYSSQKLARAVEMLTRDADSASLKRKHKMEVEEIEGSFR